MGTDAGPRAPLLGIALISTAALAFEVVLIAWFSLVQWQHFAYLVVSVALLGFGASGSFLALAGRRFAGRPRGFATAQAGLFALAAIMAPALAQRLSFNPDELLWDPAHWLRLALVIALLMLPFFCAANCIGLAFSEWRARLARIYAADLLGAGCGALAILALLFLVTLPGALVAIVLLGIAAATAFWVECGGRRAPALAAALLAVSVVALLPREWIEPRISPYKAESQLLRLPGAHVLAESHGPLGRLSVVDSGRIPLRHAPGLSLNATAGPPPQLALLVNGGALAAIARYRGERGEIAYLDQVSSALAYHLARPRRVLVLGAGGGAEVLQAFFHGVERIDAVELDPGIVELVGERFAEYAGGIYSDARVAVHVADARGFLQRDGPAYDLIQVPPLDGFAPASAGIHGLNENTVYTVEGITRALQRLAPGGYLSLTGWLRLPPRAAPKLMAAAHAALARAGVAEPARHLAMVRGLQTSTLLVASEPLDAAAIEALRAFAAARAFDLVYFPGIDPTDANRHNRLDSPWFYRIAQALVGGDSEALLADYPFDLRPATDDRPFPFHSARLGTLTDLLALRERGGGALVDSGYLALLAVLVIGLVAAPVLILLPLAWLRRRTGAPATGISRARVGIYFGALGLGFLLLEIAFIHKFILLLHHPVYAVAMVLAAFLLSAGIGSAGAGRLAAAGRDRSATRVAVIAILLLGVFYVAALGTLPALVGGAPLLLRAAICLALVMPLGVCMGMPFPLGLAATGARAPALIPWAWGINGCASVVGAALATLLALHLGFNGVVGAALACYAVAALSFPR